MNSNRNLLKRLLRLFPIKIVKEYFNEAGNATDAIEAITGSHTPQQIKDFVKNSYLITRQHIYLFHLGQTFSQTQMADFPFKIEFESHLNGEHFYFCLPIIKYDITLYNPLAEDELKFLQPVIIKIKNRTVTIHFTKIEKTVSSYYALDRLAIRRSQTKNEIENIDKITNFLTDEFGLTKLDVNKGVKHLWDNDFIDGRKVQWRKNSSIATETMDEDFTFKEKYPIEYNVLTTQPLAKTLFKYLKDDDYLCSAFDSDPSSGHINIPKFPKNANQVIDVITEILTNN
jgi:hypothetical protein